MQTSYKTTIALKIEVLLNDDLTGITGVSYLIQKPDGTKDTWVATIDDADTGLTSYTTENGDLDQTGIYVLQPKLTGATQTLFGDPVSFEINNIITI